MQIEGEGKETQYKGWWKTGPKICIAGGNYHSWNSLSAGRGYSLLYSSRS